MSPRMILCKHNACAGLYGPVRLRRTAPRAGCGTFRKGVTAMKKRPDPRPCLAAARLPFCAALVFGLAAHGYWMTNKIPFDDDLPNMWNKGATVVSGRYGLEVLRLLMPDVSMPWIYGLMSLVFLALAVCVTIRVFHIRSRVLQVLLAGVFVSFPAETGTMGYLFTAAPYALALLLSVTGVWLFLEGRRGRWAAAPLLIAFSCSVYQGYFAFASGFCVIWMIRALVCTGESPRAVFREGLRLLGMLLVSLAVYALAIFTFSRVLGLPLLEEAVNSRQSLPLRFLVAYSAWLKTLFRGYFAYVNSPASRLFHALLLAVCAAAAVIRLRGRREAPRLLLLAVCAFLFPLGCYCLYLLADNAYIHALALYPFASLYVLCAVLLDGPEVPVPRVLASAALAAILLNNLYFANAAALHAQLQYENARALYTGMLTRVCSTEGFNENSRLAILGEAPALRTDFSPYFDFTNFTLPGVNILDVRQAGPLIRNYLGFDIPFADEADAAAIRESEAFAAMPVYPYAGSVQKFGDVIVVRFS